jgi:hypothetical protein
VVLTRADLGFDFHVFYTAARAISHGQPVCDPAGIAHVRAIASHALGVPVSRASWAVYPPVLYELLVPIGYLPWVVADAIGLIALATTTFLAFRVMGVRDWRCYAIAYASVPVYTSVVVGTISGALTLAVALMWRDRHVVLAGAAMFRRQAVPVAVAADRDSAGSRARSAADGLCRCPRRDPLGVHRVRRHHAVPRDALRSLRSGGP